MEKDSGAFTDYFVLCSGTNPRQVQAIADEVELRLKTAGLRPAHVEGYKQAEWILVDYVDFIVHVFSAEKRAFYGLERLRKSATTLSVDELNTEIKQQIAAARQKKAAKKPAPPPPVARKAAGKSSAAASAVPAKKSAAKKSPAKRTAGKSSPTKKSASKRAAARKSTPRQ